MKLNLPQSTCASFSVFSCIFTMNREVGSMTGYSFSGLYRSPCLLPLACYHHSVANICILYCCSSVMFLFLPLFIFPTHNRRTISRGRKACSSLQSMRFSRLWYLSPFSLSVFCCILHRIVVFGITYWSILTSMFVIHTRKHWLHEWYNFGRWINSLY